MKLSVKKVKSFRGMEGYGFNADLYIDGVKVAFVIDEGNGGCYHYQFVSKELEAKWRSIIKEMREAKKADSMFLDDCIMARLVDEFETIKRIKRALSSGIVYKTKENSPGSFFVVKCIPTKENIAGIKARHSDAVILNNEPEDKWVGIIGRTEQK